ncbi:MULTISPECIES: SDR family oxidoreductase [Aequorivita]|uniref:SDR family oxidoreductase n=1 Tax=Aequorivita iocasae TaxID=2803865 RepID=A0ABX7DSH1_9FLAO|nr:MULTISPECIES: SDR family oxidoreductase [Aequorivita]QQX77100.1 SDR family oxidoreductase [Aequorivita iocasae]UCA56585.1 SDR family oxidoreductase [Aequorivita sp. F7]
MKILLTGANGYIGMRLLPELLENGHDIICAVRDKNRLPLDSETTKKVTVIEVDFADEVNTESFPKDIDAAYYLIHSMSGSTKNFDEVEARSAENFNKYMASTTVKQVIYLSGIINQEELSKHLSSRKKVEEILYKGNYNLTVLRAGIVVGSGSSSFEIIRDLCEKLPVMIAPKWLKTKIQPIAIRDVIAFLSGVLDNEKCFNQSFDIGGPNVLTYKEMLMKYSKIRGLKLWIISVPVMSPRLSSYWLYFVTSTSYKLAVNLVDSMKMEVVARDNKLQEILNIKPISYEEAIKKAFLKIEQNLVISSWKDSLVAGRISNLKEYIQVPKYGCLKDKKVLNVDDPERALNNIWAIGGKRGWYYGNSLWKIRGFMDRLVGGVGLRRGRTHPDQIYTGDALDFWRVLYADRERKRLLLFAEMKLPGEAWLEFCINENNELIQTATFRPKGLWGRLYWYLMLPFHYFIFGGMIRNIAKAKNIA